MKKLQYKKGCMPSFLIIHLKMKLTTLFLLATLFTSFAKNGYSQEITLNATNVTVAKVIDKIEFDKSYFRSDIGHDVL